MADGPEFNWVKARAACSAAKVFQQLRRELEDDVKTRNALRAESADYGFDTHSDAGSITVFIQGSNVRPRSVTFEQTAAGIAAFDETGKRVYDSVLTLSDAGDCRLRVSGRELEFWQFRKLVLEGLFFGEGR
jgi:hypothetical protein